jgi:dynein heavy chain
MKHNVEVLQRMTDNLAGARHDLEAINREQSLLDWEETNFPLLQAMFQAKDPYDKLWTNALNFTVKSDEWLNGKVRPCLPVCQHNILTLTVIIVIWCKTADPG